MTVIDVRTDEQALTLTLVAEFDAGPERVWHVWSDPRKLERWWGPPTWPATFERHDFVVGGHSLYFMTGPESEKARGWFAFTAIEAPHRLEFDDGFADDDGEPATTIAATHAVVTLEESGGRTRMTVRSQFTDLEHLRTMVEMGAAEGLRLAVGQIDDVLKG